MSLDIGPGSPVWEGCDHIRWAGGCRRLICCDNINSPAGSKINSTLRFTKADIIHHEPLVWTQDKKEQYVDTSEIPLR